MSSSSTHLPAGSRIPIFSAAERTPQSWHHTLPLLGADITRRRSLLQRVLDQPRSSTDTRLHGGAEPHSCGRTRRCDCSFPRLVARSRRLSLQPGSGSVPGSLQAMVRGQQQALWVSGCLVGQVCAGHVQPTTCSAHSALIRTALASGASLCISQGLLPSSLAPPRRQPSGVGLCLQPPVAA